jgi:cytochrome P450
MILSSHCCSTLQTAQLHRRALAGRRPQWFWGNLLELRKEGAARTHAKWSQEFGPVFTSYGGTRPFVFVDHPALARQVLLQNPSRPVFPSLWLGRERKFDAANILAARGEKHKSLRSAWQPVFFSGRFGPPQTQAALWESFSTEKFNFPQSRRC